MAFFFLCCCWFWQKWEHELTKNRNAAYFLASHVQDEQNTPGKQKDFTVVRVKILPIFVFKTY